MRAGEGSRPLAHHTLTLLFFPGRRSADPSPKPPFTLRTIGSSVAVPPISGSVLLHSPQEVLDNVIPARDMLKAGADYTAHATPPSAGQDVCQFLVNMPRARAVAGLQKAAEAVRWDGLREAMLRAAGGGPEAFLANRKNLARWVGGWGGVHWESDELGGWGGVGRVRVGGGRVQMRSLRSVIPDLTPTSLFASCWWSRYALPPCTFLDCDTPFHSVLVSG